MKSKTKKKREPLFSDLGLPIQVMVNSSIECIQFSLIRPIWLEEKVFRRDTLSSQLGSASPMKSNIVCHILVKKYENGKEYVLLAKKLQGLAKDQYILPGGKKTPEEDLNNCAKRELKEETGQILISSHPVSINLNIINGRPENYSVGILAEKYKGKPKNIENDINTPWEWYDIENLPEPLFEPVSIVINHYKTGKFPNLKYEDVETKIIISDQLSLPGLKS
jgi:8-oxo-dGTP diphosphatase